MDKLLKISDRIILGLAIFEDFFEDVQGIGGTIGQAYKDVYGYMPRKYKKSNFYAACLRRLSTKEIKRVMVDGRPYLRLTGKGKRKLVRYFPLLKLREKEWDGFLRVVIFDIEEIQANLRDRLRRKLRELGFRMWQRSVWVSLLPIEEDLKEFLKNNNLWGRVFILKSKEELIGNIKEFVFKVWKLIELEKKYADFLDKYEFKDSKSLTFEEKRRIKSEFLEILAKDPLLPLSVLPKEWIGERARKLIKNL